MSYSIRTDSLDEDDARRIYATHPEMRADPLEYCPTCQTTGTYRWRGEDRECDCSLQLQLQKHYYNSGVDLGYQVLDWSDFALDTPSKHAALGDVRVWLDNEQLMRRGMGIIFTGESGTGKTLLANLVIKDLIKRGIRCYATTFTEMVDAFTAGWNDDDEKKWFARKFKYSQVLLLDDLGKEYRSRNALPQTTFDNLLRTRVQGGRPTIITTNMTLEELGAGYGSSTLSLLRRQSLIVPMSGTDYSVRAASRILDEALAHETRPIV
jgi:DNA replication protein DnaC